MSKCKGCAKRSKTFKRWFRGWLKIAGSEGTRHLFTRLQRLLDYNYSEMRNELDIVRRALKEHKDTLELIINRLNEEDRG